MKIPSALILKSSGAGIIVLSGGIGGFLIRDNLTPPNQSIGQISLRHTSDNQWRFLNKLTDKIFQYLRSKSKTNDKSDLIDWLKSKFNKTTSETDWRAFKDLCSQAMISEDSLGPKSTDVSKPEVRLCFMGDPNHESASTTSKLKLQSAQRKGNFRLFKSSSDSDYVRGLPELNNWNKTNYDLWKNFKEGKGKDVYEKHYPRETDDSEFGDKFSEWFEDTNTKVDKSGTKKISEVLVSSSSST